MYLTRRMKIMPAMPGHSFVCNAITGEIMVLSEAGRTALETLRQGNFESASPALIEALKHKSLLFDSREQEETAFRAACDRSWRNFRDRSPHHYTFITNTQCNFNCPYCFEPEASRGTAATLTTEQVDAAFRLIDQNTSRFPQEDAPGFEIFGGEPLMPASLPIAAYILQNIAARGWKTSIQTNGYHLSSYIGLISEYQENIQLIQITLDGPARVHNRRRVPKSGEPTFDRIVAAIDLFLEQNLPIQLNLRTNVDRDNAALLEELAQFYQTKGWTAHPRVGFIAAPVDNRCGSLNYGSKLLSWNTVFERVFPLSTDIHGGPFDLSVFKPLTYFRNYFYTLAHDNHSAQPFVPKVIYCEAAALKLFVFHPDGKIYPCPESVGMEQMAVGRYDPEFQLDVDKARDWQAQTIFEREKCPDCEISTFCGGGCILTAYFQNGSMRIPACEETPEMIEAYFRKVSQALP